MRFRVNDRVIAWIDDLKASIEGVIQSVETEAEGDTAEIKFLVTYDVEVGGRTEGFHEIHDMRLIQGAEDKAPPLSQSPSLQQSDLPTLNDYRTKVGARTNTAFDALFCKSETGESWLLKVTPKGIYLLQESLKGMTLRDISELYGDIQRYVFSLMIVGGEFEKMNAYRNLSREILHAVLCHGCYIDYDGSAVERFKSMMNEHPRKNCGEAQTGEGE
jgi:hypothetical protein